MSPAKFLFDQDFAAASKAKPAIPLEQHEAQLHEAQTTGYLRGFAAARAEILTEAELSSAAALERIVATLEGIGHGLSRVEARLETEAIEVAVAVAKKLAAVLIEREPLAEISELATECFRHLVSAPHVVVRVSDALHAQAREQLEQAARTNGFEGRLVVLAQPEIAPGDCRIEWADGGVNRERSVTEAAIDEAVTRYVKARLAAAGQ